MVEEKNLIETENLAEGEVAELFTAEAIEEVAANEAAKQSFDADKFASKKQKRGRRDGDDREDDGLKDWLVAVNRTSKTVKGGRRFSFTALVIVGDGKGRVGFGKGKAKEVMDAKIKATQLAKKSMFKVSLKEGRTIHHDITCKVGAGRVVLRSAPSGTGVIAGGPLRPVFDALGVKDVVVKSTRSSNSFNMIYSVFKALKSINPPKLVALRRGKAVTEILAQRKA
ncbi:MAG: 30S ribosomal protein S5 [Alphaproteobacteria bacterium]|jgi:small subunit ribosomal protein S5